MQYPVYETKKSTVDMDCYSVYYPKRQWEQYSYQTLYGPKSFLQIDLKVTILTIRQYF